MKYFKSLHISFVDKYIINLVKNEILKYGKGNVIDIGCGEKPFYSAINNYVDLYIGLDHPNSVHATEFVDVFALADNLPFVPNKFDLALVTQVIEHVEEPAIVIGEIKKILKQNGILIISFPFLYPVHEAPRDFYRYTEFGIKYLAEKAGFVVEKIEPVSGFWITFFSFLSIYISRKSNLIYICLLPLLLLLKYLCILFEKLDKKSKYQWSWNYFSVLRKR